VSLSNDKICVSYFYNADTTHYDYVIWWIPE
jgi:hypothetical protein